MFTTLESFIRTCKAVAVLDVVAEITRLVPGLLDIPTGELGAMLEQAQTEV